jgi:hypothetical protein
VIKGFVVVVIVFAVIGSLIFFFVGIAMLVLVLLSVGT